MFSPNSDSCQQTEQEDLYSLRRKLNALEKEKLDITISNNEEVSRLSKELARLHAQAERTEASKQNLEYDLARVRQELSASQGLAAALEAKADQQMRNFQEKEEDQRREIERWASEFNTTLALNREESIRLGDVIRDKDDCIQKVARDYNLVKEQHMELLESLQQKQKTIVILEQTIEEMKELSSRMTEQLKNQTDELEAIREKLDRTNKELYQSLNKVQALEEAIEAERASHLQSKFSSEIVQLRIKDLEGALEKEKSAKADSIRRLQDVAEHTRDIQDCCEAERQNAMKTQDKLSHAEKELLALNLKLSNEVSDKKGVIESMVKQLQEHRTDIDKLRSELASAKQSQQGLQEIYGNAVKEIKSVLPTAVPSRVPAKSKAKSSLQSAGGKESCINTKEFTGLIQSIRNLITSQQQKYDQLASGMSNLKALNDQLSKEIKDGKQKLSTKDKSLQLLEDSLSRESESMKKIEQKLHRMEDELNEERKEKNFLKSELDHQQSIIEMTKDDMAKIYRKVSSDEEMNSKFLMLLHEQLLTVDGVAGQEHTVSPSAPPQTWNDLALVVNNEVAYVITLLCRTRNKTAYLEKCVREKESLLEQLTIAYKQETNCLLSQQKAELEQFYNNRLGEIERKQLSAIESQLPFEAKIEGVDARMSSTERDISTNALSGGEALNAECTLLRSQLVQSRSDTAALLSAIALLCGATYPLFIRLRCLSEQCKILCAQYAQFTMFKTSINDLALAMTLKDDVTRSSDMTEISGKCQGGAWNRHKRRPVGFRVAVVVVVAVNRLHLLLSNTSCLMFNNGNSSTPCRAVLVGGLKTEAVPPELRQPFATKKTMVCSEFSAVDWLTSSDLQVTILSTMNDLKIALGACNQNSGYEGSKKVADVARECFEKLLSHLPRMFPTVNQQELFDNSSLLHRLASGHRRLKTSDHKQNTLNGEHQLAGSERILARLNQCVLEFTRRLHAAEVERRDMRSELAHLKRSDKENGYGVTLTQSSTAPDDRNQLLEQIKLLHKQLQNTVPLSKYRDVCKQLSVASSREVRPLSTTNSVSSIQEVTSMNSNRLGGTVVASAVTPTVSVVGRDEEKLAIISKLRDADAALRTAARDRENIISYSNSIVDLLSKTCPLTESAPADEFWSTSAFLQVGIRPQHRYGSEFTCVRNLVAAFVRTVNYLLSQLSQQRADRLDLMRAINQLKAELTVVYRKQLDLEKSDSCDRGDHYGGGDQFSTALFRDSVPPRVSSASYSRDSDLLNCVDPFQPTIADLDLSLNELEKKLEAASAGGTSSHRIRRPVTRQQDKKSRLIHYEAAPLPRRPAPVSHRYANKSNLLPGEKRRTKELLSKN